MKHLAIRNHYSCFSIDSSEITECVFDEKMEQLDEELRVLFEKYGLSMLLHESRYIPFEKMSLCYCEKCNNLMINRDKNITRFDGDELYNDLNCIILDGGTHENKELCEECLPLTHRWGHFS